MSRSRITEAFLLSSRPFKETDCLAELWTEKLGRIRCRFGTKVPEPYRQFELKLSKSSKLQSVNSFRYTQPVLIDSSHARFMGLYVNELIYRLLPLAQDDSLLFGRYISTLLFLNESKSVQAALRYFEQGVLASIGMAVDYRTDVSSVELSTDKAYRFEAGKGFIEDARGRYPGDRILAVSLQDYSVKGALSLARECQRLQIDQALAEGIKIHSREWPLGAMFSKRGEKL